MQYTYQILFDLALSIISTSASPAGNPCPVDKCTLIFISIYLSSPLGLKIQKNPGTKSRWQVTYLNATSTLNWTRIQLKIYSTKKCTNFLWDIASLKRQEVSNIFINKLAFFLAETQDIQRKLIHYKMEKYIYQWILVIERDTQPNKLLLCQRVSCAIPYDNVARVRSSGCDPGRTTYSGV
jgi:hypothetical protein